MYLSPLLNHHHRKFYKPPCLYFNMHSFLYRYEHYFSFTLAEYKQLLITSIAAAFILSFRKWGGAEFSFFSGLFSLIYIFIFFIFSLYIHVFVQKLSGLKVGYFPTYRAYPSLLLTGVVLAFLTNGYFPFFISGCLAYTIQEDMRLGKLRKGYTLWEASLVSFSGPLISIIVAALLGGIYSIIPFDFLYTLIIVNLLIAIYSMIPFPQFRKLNPLDLIFSKSHRFATFLLNIQEGGPVGLHIFMHKPYFFVFTFSLVLFYSGLIFTTQIFALLLSSILALMTGVVYYYLVEKAG